MPMLHREDKGVDSNLDFWGIKMYPAGVAEVGSLVIGGRRVLFKC